ncbi:MAG TPA: GNAT family N-acetyltransferase [Thermoplasmata archaeon]|nr:GNAT family N-acetyltransferase [Thermoplasmata archaeon]
MAIGKSVRLTPRYPASIRVDDEIELRLVRDRDAPRIFALMDGSREYLRKWLPWVDTTRTVADTEGFVHRAHEQMGRGEGFHAGIEYRGALAGIIGHVYLDPVNQRAEIGYWLGETFQGRGIMTRTCRRMVDYAFESLGLHRVEIRVDVDNRKSRAIPERLGFVPEVLLRESVHAHGQFRDIVMYAKLRGEWELEGSRGVSKSLHGGPAVPRTEE